MAHAHHSSNMRRVIIALVLTGTFMVVEVIGGLLSGSLALLADAGHMLTDTMALALAAVAFNVSKRPADTRLTYGYQRFQILAAFVNGLSLLLIVGWILYEAVERFITPRDILGETMLLLAPAGLVVNVGLNAWMVPLWGIDGAAAARFVRFLGTRLEDLRRLTL
mgnify:CR=1 FL=1